MKDDDERLIYFGDKKKRNKPTAVTSKVNSFLLSVFYFFRNWTEKKRATTRVWFSSPAWRPFPSSIVVDTPIISFFFFNSFFYFYFLIFYFVRFSYSFVIIIYGYTIPPARLQKSIIHFLVCNQELRLQYNLSLNHKSSLKSRTSLFIIWEIHFQGWTR